MNYTSPEMKRAYDLATKLKKSPAYQIIMTGMLLPMPEDIKMELELALTRGELELNLTKADDTEEKELWDKKLAKEAALNQVDWQELEKKAQADRKRRKKQHGELWKMFK